MTVNMRRWGLGFFVRNGAAFRGLPLSLLKASGFPSNDSSVLRLRLGGRAAKHGVADRKGKAGLEKLKLCDCDGEETKVRIPQRGY